VPEPIAREHVLAGRLKEVLAKYAPTTLGVFLYFPDGKQVSPKLRAFIDHVREFATSRGDGKNKVQPHQRRNS
jgi:DNA-binding transcriptional LysR family regulator